MSDAPGAGGTTGGADRAQTAAPRCYRHADRETWVSCQRCGRPICPDCMRPASVGFHCPECVSEGKRTQRQARTVAGGAVPRDVGRVSLVLIGINVLVFVAVLGSGGFDSPVVRQAILFSADRLRWSDGALVTGVDGGAWWRLITSAFLHAQVFHILLNMYALWLFGPLLERFLGYGRFIALYGTTAVAGSVAVLWLTPANQPTLGASGAIYGLFGCAVVLLRSRGYDIRFWVVLLGINLVLTFSIPSISWQGHLGGLVAGLLLGLLFGHTPREHRQVVHASVFVAAWVLLLVAAGLHGLF